MCINCYVASIFILLKTSKILELIESMFFDMLHCYTMPAMGKGRHYLFFAIINYAFFALLLFRAVLILYVGCNIEHLY